MNCYLCENKATGRLSPDLDIKGIAFCDTHKKDMMLAYMILIHEGEEKFREHIKDLTKKYNTKEYK